MSITARRVSENRLTVDTERMQVWFDGRRVPTELTAKEVEFLDLLASRAGRICFHGEIGTRFWGEDYDPTTLHTFVSRLKRKLPKELAEGIRNVRTVGYRLEGIDAVESDSPAGRVPIPNLRSSAVFGRAVLAGALGLVLFITFLLPSSPRSFEQEEATGAAGAELLLEEDFASATEDDPASGLRPYVSIAYVDGELSVRKEGSDVRRLVAVGVDEPRADSAIAMDVRFVNESSERYVVVGCRRDVVSAGPGMNSYMLHVDPGTNQVRIGWVQNGRETPLSSLRPVPALRPADEWNHIEFSCSGPALTANINGQVVLSVKHLAFTSGYTWFGLGTQNASLDAEVRVDNLELRALH